MQQKKQNPEVSFDRTIPRNTVLRGKTGIFSHRCYKYPNCINASSCKQRPMKITPNVLTNETLTAKCDGFERETSVILCIYDTM